MLRHKNILVFVALLVFAAMTYNDVHFMFIDKEELVEGRGIERDEVNEGDESKKSGYKYHWFSGSGFLHAQLQHKLTNHWLNHKNENKYSNSGGFELSIPLFIMFCALRLHLG